MIARACPNHSHIIAFALIITTMGGQAQPKVGSQSQPDLVELGEYKYLIVNGAIYIEYKVDFLADMFPIFALACKQFAKGEFLQP